MTHSNPFIIWTTVLLVTLSLVAVNAAEQTDDTTEAAVFLVSGVVEPLNRGALKGVRVILNGGQYSTFAAGNGKFKLHDVPAGQYQLEVLSPSAEYPPVRVSISQKKKRVTCTLVGDHERRPLSYPLRLQPANAKQYFQVDPGFNPWSLLTNWQFIMMAFTLFVVVVFPKMLDSLDEEQLKEMQQQMGRDQENMNPQALLNKLMGNNDDDDD